MEQRAPSGLPVFDLEWELSLITLSSLTLYLYIYLPLCVCLYLPLISPSLPFSFSVFLSVSSHITCICLFVPPSASPYTVCMSVCFGLCIHVLLFHILHVSIKTCRLYRNTEIKLYYYFSWDAPLTGCGSLLAVDSELWNCESFCSSWFIKCYPQFSYLVRCKCE